MTETKPVQWLCLDCGKTHTKFPISAGAVGHYGKCDCCGIKTSVTSARNYGVWEIEMRAEQ